MEIDETATYTLTITGRLLNTLKSAVWCAADESQMYDAEAVEIMAVLDTAKREDA